MRVLLVEDSLTQALILRRYIEAIPGWRVLHAKSLGEAKGAVAQDGAAAFGIVVVDLTLPDAHELEAVAFATTALPDAICVVVSGVDQVSTAIEALRIGASDYLVKSSRNMDDPDTIRRTLHLAVTRRELQLQHQQAEENLRGLLTGLRDAIFVLDDTGAVLFDNPFARTLNVVFDAPTPGASFIAADAEVVEERTVRAHSGPDVPVEVRTSPLAWARKPARLVVLRDLSSERRAQVAEAGIHESAQLADVGKAAVNAWHDAGNKLRGVLRQVGQAEGVVTLDGDDPPPLSVVRREVDELISVSERFRHTGGAHRVLRVPVDLAALAQQRCFAFRPNTEQERLRMQLSPTPEVLGDPILLGQVIDNLLWNALKAIRRSRRATGTIVVATQVDNGHVEVRVTDDGPGFVGPPESFWARGTSGDTTGTGLGLANVRETIHKHDGSCGIHSPPGEGASVWFQLPAIPQAPSRRRRVLLLEDDAFAGRAAQLRLGKVHEVVLVEDGQEGVEQLEDGLDPDVILCDLQMPRMGGMAFFAHLGERWPHLVDRVVFCSGDAMDAASAQFLSTVPNTVKPLTPEVALALIEQVARRARG